MSRKIAITGSRGFVGKYLINLLMIMGFETIEIDHEVGINLQDLNTNEFENDFEVLVHLAADSFVPDSYIKPKKFYFNNFVSTLNCLELCRKYDAKIIYISSYVYGHPRYLPIDEEHPISALNPYAQSKILCEELVNGYERDFNLSAVIIRPFNLYGIGQNSKFLIPKIIKQCFSGKVILEDSTPRRDMLFIDDFIDLIIKIINTTNIKSGIYNAGYGRSYSVGEIVNSIIKSINKDIDVKYTGNTRQNEIMDTISENRKAKSDFGWLPIISLDEGINKIISNIENINSL